MDSLLDASAPVVAEDAKREGPLGYLPVALFGAVIGLAGLASAWRLAAVMFDLPLWIAQGMGLLALAAFVAMAVAYAIKALTGFERVIVEYRHPIVGNLSCAPLISLLLLVTPLSDYSLLLARVVWVVATVGMLGFAWLIVLRWFSRRLQVVDVAPAWVVPMLGLMNIPAGLPSLHWPDGVDVGWFGLSIGLFLLLPAFVLILFRLLFDEPLAESQQPSLLFLAAPTAVAFSAWVNLGGGVDHFATGLYMVTLFLLAVLLSRLRRLIGSGQFRLSWWAMGFPLTAAAGCALRYADHEPGVFTLGLAGLLLSLATGMLGFLSVRTLLGIASGRLRELAG